MTRGRLLGIAWIVLFVAATLSEAGKLEIAYTIEKEVNGKADKAHETDLFVSGDQLRLKLDATESAYVYVIARGTSGEYYMLFPTSDSTSGDNLVQKGTEVTVPARGWFEFVGTGGYEHLTLIATEVRLGEFDIIQDRPETSPDLLKAVRLLRNRTLPDYKLAKVSVDDTITLTLKNAEPQPVLISDIFIYHRKP